MSWEIKQSDAMDIVVLDSDMRVQNALDFYQAVVPLSITGKAVSIDATSTRSIHTSILQILYALSQAVRDFSIAGASDEFRLAEARVGLSFPRNQETGMKGDKG